jgi:hypothetical protein
MSKRAVLSYNDPKSEFPENRSFNFDLLEEVRKDRAKLVVAALTLIKAYLVAGSPPIERERTRFYQAGWDRLVRFPIIWAGGGDVAESMKVVLEDDPDRAALGALLEAWYACYRSHEKRVSEVINDSSTSGHDKRALLDAFKEALDVKPGGGVEAKQLGEWLAGHQNRAVNGFKFQKGGITGGVRKWKAIKSDDDI